MFQFCDTLCGACGRHLSANAQTFAQIYVEYLASQNIFQYFFTKNLFIFAKSLGYTGIFCRTSAQKTTKFANPATNFEAI
jgi:hypothetical protein